jgi:hypothetical protein
LVGVSVSSSMPAKKSHRQLAIDRQDKVIASLLETLTGDALTREELDHFALTAFYFPVVSQKIDEIFGSELGRADLQRELLVAALVYILRKLA